MPVRLLGTATSPYVRIVRVQILQCALADQVAFEVVPTRVAETPLHAHNPTGKVPTLVLAGGVALSETRLVCEYLDTLHAGTPFAPAPADAAERALQGFAVGCLDGIAVWARELRRPAGERSPGILAQEQRRAGRCLAWLEANAARLRPARDYTMCVLAVAFARLDRARPEGTWRNRHPAFAAWMAAAESLPGFVATRPN